MANLKYSDKHNMVAFLKKPNESVGFTEVVDFLKGTSLRYALTHNPTIYDSLVKQFWQTVTVRTLANGTQQLVASIDSIEYTITEASIRSKLQLADATRIHNLSDAEIYAGLATLGPKSGGWDQFGSTVATALICLSSNRVYNFSKMIFDGMVHNLESNTKFLMYPRFLQIILDINTEHKGKYLAPTLTKKLFANMKRGYAGDIVPLLPAMLAGAAMDQGEGSAQPAEPHPTPVDPLPSTSLPHQSPPHSPFQSPPHSPHQSPPHSPHQSPPHSPFQSPPYSPPHSSPPRSYEAPLPEGNTSGSAKASIQLKELMVLVPSLVTRVTSLEKELKDTKQTLGNVVPLIEGREPEDQGRIIHDIDDDPLVYLVRGSMKEKSTNFVTPTKALGEAQEEEEISPTILEAAKTLSKIASQSVSKAKSIDKGKRYRRRARSMAKKINTELDAEDEINTGRVEINFGIEDVNTGSSKVDTGRTSISTSSIIHSPKKGQREGKAQMVEEDIQATHKTKEQIRQEEAGLEEKKQDYQTTKRRAEVQKAAQFYTEEDWDTIREKLEANTEETKQEERHGLQLEQETSKKQKIDIEEASITKGKDEVVKEEETEVLVKKTGMRRTQKARKGININKTAQDEFNKEREAYVKDKVIDASPESEIRVDVIPTATKLPTIVNWKIISQSSQKDAYQIIRKDGSDKIYMSFGAILKDFSRDELVELYRLVIKKYGANTPKEMYDRVLWGDLKTMFDPPLSDDAIWSLPLQQKIINWRYYPTCAVHYLTLDASTIYMLAERKHPLSKDACQVMLKMKLLDGTMDEVCYQLLKMIEKQAGIRK
ncbi:hypothetical protein Tco_0195882 [Tanacetum coccineum]